MNESIDTFKVIYICRKTNLCLVLQEDFTKSNYFVNDTNFIETFQRIVKETEYLKIRVVDNKLQILFQSLKRNCTKLDLENTHLFKLLYVKDRYLFHVNHNLENNQNLEIRTLRRFLNNLGLEMVIYAKKEDAALLPITKHK